MFDTGQPPLLLGLGAQATDEEHKSLVSVLSSTSSCQDMASKHKRSSAAVCSGMD